VLDLSRVMAGQGLHGKVVLHSTVLGAPPRTPEHPV
jgi:hypothetical protein